MKTSWRSVAGTVTQGSILGPIQFSTFTNDGAERTLSRFTDNTKPRGAIDTADDHAATQRDLNRLAKWAKENLTEFS